MLLGRENKRVIGKASSCDQGLNRKQAFSLHPSRENTGICAGSRRPSTSMRPPLQAARHGRAHPLPLAALCIHLPYVCPPAGTRQRASAVTTHPVLLEPTNTSPPHFPHAAPHLCHHRSGRMAPEPRCRWLSMSSPTSRVPQTIVRQQPA